MGEGVRGCEVIESELGRGERLTLGVQSLAGAQRLQRLDVSVSEEFIETGLGAGLRVHAFDDHCTVKAVAAIGTG